MIIGMVIVYVFLLVLMLSVNLSAMLFKDGDVRSSGGSAKPGKARKKHRPDHSSGGFGLQGETR